MHRIVFRNLFTFLIAMALLPMQGFVTHFQSQSEASQLVIESFSSPQASDSQIPTSQSHVIQDSVGIVSSSRWLSQFRKLLDDEDNSDQESSNPFYLDSGQSYYLSDTCAYYRSAIDLYPTNHRLSGWKDSNAMYVALNSQFSS